MIDSHKSTLRVELLKPSHLSTLLSTKQANNLNWVQISFLRSWVAQAERYLPVFLKTRQPICLLAFECERPIAYLLIQPNNKRRTCWLIHSPVFLEDPKTYGSNHVRRELLQYALSFENIHTDSWILRCSATDTDQLSIARELGFQKLKLTKNWTPSTFKGISKDKDFKLILNVDLEWQRINKSNAPILLKLAQTTQSAHLRQIYDYQWEDLLDLNNRFSSLLVSNQNSNQAALAGILTTQILDRQIILELVRDVALDARIISSIPIIFKKLPNSFKEITIETNEEDTSLNNLLLKMNWKLNGENILLGRSLWRRQENNNSIKGSMPLESMLGRLNPQNPPLPTPSLSPR